MCLISIEFILIVFIFLSSVINLQSHVLPESDNPTRFNLYLVEISAVDRNGNVFKINGDMAFNLTVNGKSIMHLIAAEQATQSAKIVVPDTTIMTSVPDTTTTEAYRHHTILDDSPHLFDASDEALPEDPHHHDQYGWPNKNPNPRLAEDELTVLKESIDDTLFPIIRTHCGTGVCGLTTIVSNIEVSLLRNLEQMIQRLESRYGSQLNGARISRKYVLNPFIIICDYQSLDQGEDSDIINYDISCVVSEVLTTANKKTGDDKVNTRDSGNILDVLSRLKPSKFGVKSARN